MKKINLIFGIILTCIAVASVLHTFIGYNIAFLKYNPFETSFPPEAIFIFVGIWYLIGIGVLLFVWLTVLAVNKFTNRLKKILQ